MCNSLEWNWLQCLAQPRESARGAALDRPRRIAENLGNLAFAQVVEVAQDEHGSLTRRQLPERLEEFGTRVQRRERVCD